MSATAALSGMQRMMTALAQRVTDLETIVVKIQAEPGFKIALSSQESELQSHREDMKTMRAELDHLKLVTQAEPPPALIVAKTGTVAQWSGGTQVPSPRSVAFGSTGATTTSPHRLQALSSGGQALYPDSSMLSSGRQSVVATTARGELLEATMARDERKALQLLGRDRNGGVVTMARNEQYYRLRDDRDPTGMTSLHWAGIKNLPILCNTLLDDDEGGKLARARDNKLRTCFHYAGAYGNDEVCKIFLEHAGQSQTRPRVEVEALDEDGCTVLHHAAENGFEEVCKMLIDSPCFSEQALNAKDAMDRTALHSAARNGHADVVQLLLDAPSFTGFQDKDHQGDTALATAAYSGSSEAVKVLIEHPRAAEAHKKDLTDLIQCKSTGQQSVLHHVRRGILSYAGSNGPGLVAGMPAEEVLKAAAEEASKAEETAKAKEALLRSEDLFVKSTGPVETPSLTKEKLAQLEMDPSSIAEVLRQKLRGAAWTVCGNEYERFFAFVDLDNSESVSALEFEDMCKRNGFAQGQLTHEDIQAIFKHLDADQSGSVSSDEMVNWMKGGPVKDKKKPPSPKALKGKKEFVSQPVAQEAPKAADKPNFKGLLTDKWKVQEGLRMKLSDAVMKSCEGDYDRFFALADRDGSKTITRAEFAITCRRHGMSDKDMSNADVKAIFQYLDSDGSGSVSPDEMISWMTGERSQRTMTPSAVKESTLLPEELKGKAPDESSPAPKSKVKSTAQDEVARGTSPSPTAASPSPSPSPSRTSAASAKQAAKASPGAQRRSVSKGADKRTSGQNPDLTQETSPSKAKSVSRPSSKAPASRKGSAAQPQNDTQDSEAKKTAQSNKAEPARNGSTPPSGAQDTEMKKNKKKVVQNEGKHASAPPVWSADDGFAVENHTGGLAEECGYEELDDGEDFDWGRRYGQMSPRSSMYTQGPKLAASHRSRSASEDDDEGLLTTSRVTGSLIGALLAAPKPVGERDAGMASNRAAPCFGVPDRCVAEERDEESDGERSSASGAHSRTAPSSSPRRWQTSSRRNFEVPETSCSSLTSLATESRRTSNTVSEAAREETFSRLYMDASRRAVQKRQQEELRRQQLEEEEEAIVRACTPRSSSSKSLQAESAVSAAAASRGPAPRSSSVSGSAASEVDAEPPQYGQTAMDKAFNRLYSDANRRAEQKKQKQESRRQQLEEEEEATMRVAAPLARSSGGAASSSALAVGRDRSPARSPGGAASCSASAVCRELSPARSPAGAASSSATAVGRDRSPGTTRPANRLTSARSPPTQAASESKESPERAATPRRDPRDVAGSRGVTPPRKKPESSHCRGAFQAEVVEEPWLLSSPAAPPTRRDDECGAVSAIALMVAKTPATATSGVARGYSDRHQARLTVRA